MLPLRHHRRGLSSPSRSKLEATAGRDDGDDGSFDTDVVKDTELSEAATGDGASGAAEGWQGWVDGVVAKVKGALPEPAEAKKILPLGLMLFFILFDYTILRDTKVSRTFAAHAAMFAFRPTLHQQDYNCYKAGQRPKEERKGVSIYSSSCCTDPYHTTQMSRGGGHRLCCFHPRKTLLHFFWAFDSRRCVLRSVLFSFWSIAQSFRYTVVCCS